MITQCLLDLFIRKTTLLQKTRLLGTLGEAAWRASAEPLLAYPLQLGQPILRPHVAPTLNGLTSQALLFQLLANTHRPIAAPPSTAGDDLGQTFIGKIILNGEHGRHVGRDSCVTTLSYQLRNHFGATMFAPREPPDGQAPRGAGVDCGLEMAQASTSSSATASAVSVAPAGADRTFSRMRCSISAATASFSFK